MTLVVIAIAVGIVAIAWACAWQTMNWLGDAEDLIELVRSNIDDPWWWADELRGWRRRTPRRRRSTS